MIPILAIAMLIQSPPAMPAMYEAQAEYRQALLLEELHDLNGPYTIPQRRRVVNRTPPSSVESWREAVAQSFGETADAALIVMACESRGDPSAVNPYSGAAGLFQFMPFWWQGKWDPFDPYQNIAHAAELSKGGTDWSHWECKPNGSVVQLDG